MYVHTDEVLFDPLPQPYRFLNKLLLQAIEDAMDLSEGGGSQETMSAFVGHNLKLAKIGKVPTFPAREFFLSTEIVDDEIAVYDMLGDTQFLVAGTSQGVIAIYDTIEKVVVYNAPINTLSKSARLLPITHLRAFATDHENFVVAFATEEAAFVIFLNQNLNMRSAVELNISLFTIETMTIEVCAGPHLVITDGTGRTSVYNCRTPSEIIALEGVSPLKSQTMKAVQLEPVLVIEKCPISTGPVSSESQLVQKVEETAASKKRQVKKKPAQPAKGRTRAKSPGSVAIENAQAAEMTRYHATVSVFENAAVARFGTFPMLLIYSLQQPNTILNEFPLPSSVSTSLELLQQNQLVVGFENGSFCFLNVPRKSLHDHQFPKKGSITKIMMQDDNTLLIFTSMKSISAYRIENCHVKELLYTCSDDDILESHLCAGAAVTYNQKSSNLNLVQTLTTHVQFEERDIHLFPNVSAIEEETGAYIGTAATPMNLAVVQTLWNKNFVTFVYVDPVEYRQPLSSRLGSSQGKRGASSKNSKPTSAARKVVSKNAKQVPKKGEEVKEEPEETVVIKRHIISVLNLGEILADFHQKLEMMEQEKLRRRMKLRGIPIEEPVEEQHEDDEVDPSILCQQEETE